ncbi:hypothetical protein Bhyg_12075 [Pseudolycoriella hygida]|uniref:Uncharacterized protein n=1 Tax=Pseudolycoriella hygida TaxID=35572 RepID=A0A9Q0S0I6_9DIPT|nr:hypothetical protein Bhyg_12075 [Pseudolycoriella hygida]
MRGRGSNRGSEPHLGTARRRGRPTNTNIGVNKDARPTHAKIEDYLPIYLY